jgi:hypothetical protein
MGRAKDLQSGELSKPYFLRVALLITVSVAVVAFRAASEAVTVRRLGPFFRSIAGVLHEEVPTLAAPRPPRSFCQVTLTTPTLSDNVPLNEMVDAGVV